MPRRVFGVVGAANVRLTSALTDLRLRAGATTTHSSHPSDPVLVSVGPGVNSDHGFVSHVVVPVVGHDVRLQLGPRVSGPVPGQRSTDSRVGRVSRDYPADSTVTLRAPVLPVPVAVSGDVRRRVEVVHTGVHDSVPSYEPISVHPTVTVDHVTVTDRADSKPHRRVPVDVGDNLT